MYFIWPVVQNGIYALGGLCDRRAGYIGTLIFGIIKRALIPFGLHHVFYMPFWQTAVGGTMEVAGQMVQGGQNIFFRPACGFCTCSPFQRRRNKIFLRRIYFYDLRSSGSKDFAMYRCAKPEKKKKAAGGLLLSAPLACMLTGITEPLEFSLPVRSPGTVCSTGCSCRCGLYDRAYAEHCSRTYFLRRFPGSVPVRNPSGKCKRQAG